MIEDYQIYLENVMLFLFQVDVGRQVQEWVYQKDLKVQFVDPIHAK